jgi:hypothetical protein
MAELTLTDYQDRASVITEAAYQVDKLIEVLQLAARSPGVTELEWLIRAIAPRLMQLNGAIMRCTDSEDSVEDIRGNLEH